MFLTLRSYWARGSRNGCRFSGSNGILPAGRFLLGATLGNLSSNTPSTAASAKPSTRGGRPGEGNIGIGRPGEGNIGIGRPGEGNIGRGRPGEGNIGILIGRPGEGNIGIH
jgi:hypothetical protein